MGHSSVYGYAALQQAITDSQLATVSDPRIGLIAGTGGNGIAVYEGTRVQVQEGFEMLDPYWVPRTMGSSMVANLATLFKIRGANRAETSACATSAHCLGTAFDLIRLGRQDVVLVVGSEEMGWWSAAPFAAMMALSRQVDPKTASRPYDRKRDGFVISGGATALVLESEAHAQARGARSYAKLLGWGESSDGYNLVLPHPKGEGAARAMQLALQESNRLPTAVDYINTHGTSTVGGDEAEVAAIRQVFQEQIPPFSSTKSITGHAIGAAGALEAGICCLALAKQFLPASMNITELDPKFSGLPIVTTPGQSSDLKVVMSNSFGFGGTNVSLVFEAVTK
jgi:3-oxoacyl-[acyl-carrier-protein] synthase-1